MALPLVVVLLLLPWPPQVAQGYSSGLVGPACGDLVPGHPGRPQSGPSNYSVEAAQGSFNVGDAVVVTIATVDAGTAPFLGFLLQALDPTRGLGSPLGTFILTGAAEGQLLDCGGRANSAVSHRNSAEKRRVQVTWIAPNPSPDYIMFRATLVRALSTYWVAQRGDVLVRVGVPMPGPGTAWATDSPWPLLGSVPLTQPVSDVGCGRDRSCLRWPPRCLVNAPTPCLFASLAATGNSVAVEMSGPDLGYLALGFSHDTTMGGDDVCHVLHPLHAPLAGLMLKHEQQPLVSRVAVRLTGTPTEVPGSRSPTIIKAHGALMMVAWLTCASVGIVLARFFKPLWPTHYIWGQKVWFQLHRSFMTTVVLCSLVAFTLPFVYRAGWSHGAHPIVGCLVVVLAVAQPLMALVRPHPGEPRRSLFNWTHWATGTAARTAAVAAMFLGVDMTSLDLPDTWDKLTLIGAVAWQVATELLLEAHAHRGCRAGSSVGMELRGVAGTVAGTVAKEQSERSGTGHTFKKTVLAVYVAGNLVFLIVYLVAIEQA
uniref:Ferric-chelate reductase 1-like n=1 Tax=Petromyzon marinus TaxID=7757 RepID=A0AAJ7UI80_PETMA|nr:ferric-chelate reductase 1-like [Petromyzon marinus]